MSKHSRLKDTNFSSRVENTINEFLDYYGIDSTNHKKSYVVFDFDNTVSIFDIEEQFMIYQLENMVFNLSPTEFGKVISKDVDLNQKIDNEIFKNTTYKEIIDTLVNNYSYLYKTYGPFENLEIEKETKDILIKDLKWINFAGDMLGMYETIPYFSSSALAYSWLAYWQSNLTPSQVYKAAYKAAKQYQNQKIQEVSYKTSHNTFTKTITGVSIAASNIKLMEVLKDNGFDIYICSASSIDIVRAATDVLGIKDYVDGVIAKCLELDENGRYLTNYNVNDNVLHLKKNNEWVKDTNYIKYPVYGIGKVEAINSTLYPLYNSYPIAGFMDSTGDFEFCTMYKDMKMAICFNRADRSLKDGGGLISVIAKYQEEKDLIEVNKNSDTLYLLQGRNENGLGDFTKSDKTIRLNKIDEQLFKDDSLFVLLEKFKKENIAIGDAINTYANNFLDNYKGYHTI